MPHQHPHQLSFHRPSGLKVITLSGTTSDEIWPHLDGLLQKTFPGLREKLETQENKRRAAVRNAITADFRTDASSQYD
jgi:nucleoside-triphosphate--adenylate kinase